MLFTDFENVEGRVALERTVHAFVQKLVARVRGDQAHLPSAA